VRLGPGPGSYNLRGEISNGKAVAWKPKRNMLRIDDLMVKPGPGSYNIQSTVPQIQDYEKKRLEERGIKLTV
jgi:Sperm-tail PG-rich repeat